MLDKKTVIAAARGRWESIFRCLAPALVPAIECSPRHAPECPMPNHQARGKDHGKKKFRLPENFRERGMAICTCGQWKDGFSLLMALNGWSFADTVEKVGIYLGLSADHIQVISTDESRAKTVEGKVLFTGIRRMKFKGDDFEVFSLRMKPRNQTTSVVFSGTLLQKACEVAGIKVGDNAVVSMTGIQTCRTAKGLFKRKVFAVTRLPSDAEVAQAQKAAREHSEECRRNVETLWRLGKGLNETQDEAVKAVREYLSNRSLGALPEAFTKDLRAKSGLKYRNAAGVLSRWDGMIAAVRDLKGNLVCVHRTFLSKGKKAPVDTPKMLMSVGQDQTVAGCAVHLGEPDTVLCLAEGIETAASVVIGTGYPCWSCVSANGLKAVRLPEKVKLVFIFEDKDRSETGQKAAAALRERLEAEGRIAVVCSISDAIPEGSHGLDWNDILSLPDGARRFPVRKPQ